MAPDTLPDAARRRRAVTFARRVYPIRALGLGLGALCVGAVFRERGAAPLVWAALALHSFLWPHAAWALAKRSPDPRRVEHRSLLADSAFGGVWIGLMAFNLLPSVLLATMLLVDKIAAGGRGLLARSAACLAAGAAAASAANGFAFAPATSMSVVIASMPFLVSYPLAIATVSAALSARVRHQNRLLAEMNRTDALTGLPNRVRFEEVALSELRRSARSGRPACLLLLDVDGFKGINDTYGHAAGDEVLRRVAGILRANLRDIDTPGRWGGDEFCALLPETSLDAALLTADRLRAAAASAAAAGDAGATVSVGVASTAGARDVRGWLAVADSALYSAKAKGRNRVAGA